MLERYKQQVHMKYGHIIMLHHNFFRRPPPQYIHTVPESSANPPGRSVKYSLFENIL